MDIATIIGIAGSLTILVAFIANQMGYVKNEDLSYDGANVVGSALLVTYAFMISSIPFLVLNTVWLLVSLKDVIKALKK